MGSIILLKSWILLFSSMHDFPWFSINILKSELNFDFEISVAFSFYCFYLISEPKVLSKQHDVVKASFFDAILLSELFLAI